MVIKSRLFKTSVNCEEEFYNVSLCLCEIDKLNDIIKENKINTILLNYKLPNFFHLKELKILSQTSCESKIKDYLLGRYATKKALFSLFSYLNLKEILIKNGIFNQPIIENCQKNLSATISHSKNLGISLVFDSSLIFGVDVEKYDIKKIDSLKRLINPKEINLLKDLELDLSRKLMILWVIKEALGKCLKTGINVNLKILDINQIHIVNEKIIGDFKNFPQYKFITFNYADFNIAIVCPKNLNFNLSSESLSFLPVCNLMVV
ncbi:MAG: 4'-phosphopantetheinyl transferase superfamily protein [Oscillospiraceae bacterium]|jgi:phosphopantetheinyl transferase|nr:4'-phosphopantetheinyl transferase superfamily protein [Oscillospiraceae bacterium]